MFILIARAEHFSRYTQVLVISAISFKFWSKADAIFFHIGGHPCEWDLQYNRLDMKIKQFWSRTHFENVF